MDKPKTIRAKFTPFPRKPRERGRGTKRESRGVRPIDLEKIKELYLDGTDYTWDGFCKKHNFSPQGLRNLWRDGDTKDGPCDGHSLWNDWKVEWQRKQLQIADDELTPDILQVTRSITEQRIRFVRDWGKRAQFMKTLFDAMLNKHGEDLKHDIANELAIRAGTAERKFKLDATEMSVFAGTSIRLQELEMKSLLVVADPDKIRKIREAVEDAQEEIPEVEVATMGAIGMNGTEIVKFMGSYFDQIQPQITAKPAEAEQPTVITVEPEQADAEEDQV